MSIGARMRRAASGLLASDPGGGDPGDLPVTANLQLWLDAAEITGVSADDPLGVWEDQSPQGNDATSSGTDRPTYKTGPARVDFTSFARFMNLTGMTVASGPHTVFWVCDNRGTSGESFLIDAQSGRLIVAIRGGSSTTPGWFDGSWRTVSPSATTGLQLLTFRPGGSPSEVRRDGTQLDTLSYTNRAVGGTVRLGRNHSSSGGAFDGDMYEVLWYSGAMSTSDVEDVEAYLMTKHGL